MRGRRRAALLCVLLWHALLLYLLTRVGPAAERAPAELETAAITLFLPPNPEPAPTPRAVAPAHAPLAPPRRAEGAAATPAVPAGQSGAITLPGRVDWPIEGRKSAA